MSIPASLIPGMAPSATGQAGKRSREGRKAAAQGDAWEAELENAHKGYQECGVALITKRPVPTSPAPRSWVAPQHQKFAGIIRVLSKRSACDYSGCVKVDPFHGRTVMMEAKHTASAATSLPVILRGKASGLQYHQLTELRRVRRFGGYGCVVWKNGDQRLILLPDKIEAYWVTATEAMSNGRRKQVSIPANSFTQFSRDVIRSMDDGREWGEVENWLVPLVQWVREKNNTAASIAGKDE